MTYEIRSNPQFNSNEVYFEGKPSEEVRAALKALKFRWHGVKRCWYGYASEGTIADAIVGASTETEPATVIGEGYMGGGAVYGSKSNRNLYGSDLSAAIRADIKAAGIKGVSVKCHSYSGGQSITATVKLAPADYIPWEQFLDSYQISPSTAWIYYGPGSGEYMHIEKFYALDGDERERIRKDAAAYDWEKVTTKTQTVHRISWVNWLTEAARQKLEQLDKIIAAYRFDESNSMVDYFHTNFYYDIDLKPVTA